MVYIKKEQRLVIDYSPGKGAWTYHLKLPGTKEIKGKWGDIKVMGTIDGFDIGCKNLMPHKGGDKWIAVNGDIRKAINKISGDTVTVTLYLKLISNSDDHTDILECFRDADVMKQFAALPEKEQKAILADILSQQSDALQEKRILYFIIELERSATLTP
jgi:hypothetical protein